MALSDVKICNTKPAEKQIKLFDGDGLFLLVTPQGGKYFRLKYRFEGKEKLLALGTYPEIGPADARERREKARKLLADGIDPGAARKAQKQAETSETKTFEVIAREWHTKFTPTWTQGHAKTIMVAGQVFRYAVSTGRAERDSSADLRVALPQPSEKHHAAITDPKEVAPLLRTTDGYRGGFVVRCALRLAPLFFVRPGELRNAEWAEVDLAEAVWTIPATKMKMKQSQIVPLCRQAVEILEELKQLTGAGKYVFPSSRSSTRPMSENTILASLRSMGYDKEIMTGHGFMAMARTILDEVLQIRPDFIEHQLAHAVKDPNRRACNRTANLPGRRKMMQTWADYLDGLKQGATLIPFKVN